MTNRKDEWEVHDSRAQHYHENQWKNPKQSTKAFFNFAKIELSQSSHILDCGGGSGGPSFYLASLLPTVQFTVFDYSFELITEDRLANNEFNQRNLAFQQGDIYALKRDFCGNCDGIISLQTLSWLPDFQEPLAAMMEIGVKFIAISSLFFEGNISTTTQVLEHKR